MRIPSVAVKRKNCPPKTLNPIHQVCLSPDSLGVIVEPGYGTGSGPSPGQRITNPSLPKPTANCVAPPSIRSNSTPGAFVVGVRLRFLA